MHPVSPHPHTPTTPLHPSPRAALFVLSAPAPSQQQQHGQHSASASPSPTSPSAPITIAMSGGHEHASSSPVSNKVPKVSRPMSSSPPIDTPPAYTPAYSPGPFAAFPSASPTSGSPESGSSNPYPSPQSSDSHNSSSSGRTGSNFTAARLGMTPVNVSSAVHVSSNSELRVRASPIGRPAQPLHQHPTPATLQQQQQQAQQQYGVQSRHGHSEHEHSGGGGGGGSGAAPALINPSTGSPGMTQRFLTALTPKSLLGAFTPRGTHSRKSSDPLNRMVFPASASATSAPSRRLGAFLTQVLCFVGGMMLMYIVLSSSIMPSTFVITVPHAETKPAVFAALTPSAVAPAAAGAPLPLCGANDYADGEWVYDSSITKAPYVSNEWDNVCDAPEVPPPPPPPNADGTPAVVAPPPPPKPSIRPELQYRWVPSTCRLAPYSREAFCELLKGRSILFAGDSISGQHVSSFVHLLSSTPDTLWIRDEFFRHDVMTVCQDMYPADEVLASAGRHPVSGKALPGIRVGFRRNNFLSLDDSAEKNSTEEVRKWNTNQAWFPEVAEHKYDIAVINTGIWMVDAPVYEAMLTGIRAALQRDHPSLTVLWRSTQPGHAHCHTHWARPQKRLYGIADTTGGSARFRWEEAEERNRIARNMFPKEFFDVWTPTHLRPDGHMPGECLHYCQPGPVDEWHKLLFHRLAILKPEFVQKLLAKEAAAAVAATM